MTNEEHVEEILIEAYKLGLTSKVFELVKSLSDKYFELKGTILLPVKNEKGLDIPWMDIPTIFKPKSPTKPQKVIETDRDMQEFERLKAARAAEMEM